ncbi:MAG: hypothetical protein IKE92_11155 [Clostridiales bacterium]|nr:hypothetical protein [Clostridiales bacterium]
MRSFFDSEKISGRTFTKVLSVIMCVVMLAGTVGLSGCKVINNITNGLNASQKFISEAELARLMTNAVNNDSNVSDCYASIPDAQLDDLSYSMFSEYCSILRKCAQKHGTADSFKILTENEKQAYFQTIDSEDEDLRSVYFYGELDVVELCFSKDKAPSAPPVRFIIAKRGGNYYMARSYIVDTMLAYSYINHYFEMIDDMNVDGLEAIIKSAYDSDIYLNSVIRAKAEYIADYYRLKVKSNASDFELNLFSPTHISYVIPEVYTVDGTSFFSKTVELRLKKDGNYTLEDSIPATVRELRFSREGGSKLRMGSTYTFSEIRKILGSPKFSTTTSELVILAYDGMTLRLEADIEPDGQWSSGRLVSILLRKDNAYTFSEDLFIGMNVSELLLVYPMFDECGYTGSFKNGDGEFVLSFEFDDYGNVSSIELGEAVG